jgi:uncharacterized protein (DUF488 family)
MAHPSFTIGHSTRTIDEFVELLRIAWVTQVVDVRTVPRSRTNPRYNRDVLGETLAGFQIGYEHIATASGARTPRHRYAGQRHWPGISRRRR